MDTYNDATPRFATSLLYLRSPPRGGGGETLFAADAEAGTKLLDVGAESMTEKSREDIFIDPSSGAVATHFVISQDRGVSWTVAKERYEQAWAAKLRQNTPSMNFTMTTEMSGAHNSSAGRC